MNYILYLEIKTNNLFYFLLLPLFRIIKSVFTLEATVLNRNYKQKYSKYFYCLKNDIQIFPNFSFGYFDKNQNRVE